MRHGYRNALTRIIALLALYFVFLLLVPKLTAAAVPCLSGLAESYADAECTVALVLDRYLLMALAGFTAVILSGFFLFRAGGQSQRSRFGSVLVLAVCCAAGTIAAYYLFIPFAEHRVQTAPIILDSMNRPELP